MIVARTVAFDELERRLYDTVASPSILCDHTDPESLMRLTIVRRAAQGEALSAADIERLKVALEGAVADREKLSEDAPNPELRDAFASWLDPLGDAWALTVQAQALILGGGTE